MITLIDDTYESESLGKEKFICSNPKCNKVVEIHDNSILDPEQRFSDCTCGAYYSFEPSHWKVEVNLDGCSDEPTDEVD